MYFLSLLCCYDNYFLNNFSKIYYLLLLFYSLWGGGVEFVQHSSSMYVMVFGVCTGIIDGTHFKSKLLKVES